MHIGEDNVKLQKSGTFVEQSVQTIIAYK